MAESNTSPQPPPRAANDEESCSLERSLTSQNQKSKSVTICWMSQPLLASGSPAESSHVQSAVSLPVDSDDSSSDSSAPRPPAAERRWSETCWLGVQNFAHFYWLTSDSLFFLPVVACNALLVSCVCTVHLRALISVCVGEMERLRTCLRVTATVKGGGDASGPPAPKQARYFRQSRHRCFYQDQRWQG